MNKSIPFYSSLLGEGTTNEILLYGLIEVLSFKDDFCYASSEYMAERLGLAQGTIKNLLSSIAKKGWIHVEVEGNKRVAIMPILNLSPQKVDKKPAKKACGKPVENSARASRRNDGTVTQELRYRHARMTLSSGVKQGSDIKVDIKVDKEINKESEKKSPAGSAGNLPASRLKRPLRKDFENDVEFEKAFYAWNTALMAPISS